MISTDTRIMKDKLKKAAVKCYRIMGFGIHFVTQYNITSTEGLKVKGLLGSQMLESNINQSNQVSRNRQVTHHLRSVETINQQCEIVHLFRYFE